MVKAFCSSKRSKKERKKEWKEKDTVSHSCGGMLGMPNLEEEKKKITTQLTIVEVFT